MVLQMRGRAIALAALAAGLTAAASPASVSADPPTVQHPAVVLSYYSARELPNIVRALGTAGLPAGTPVYYGNYYGTSSAKGPSKGPPKPPPPEVDVPNGIVAPIFPWVPSKFWAGRHKAGGGLRGSAPAFQKLLSGPPGRSYSWGRELGSRFRDRVRELIALKKKDIGAWQFDEIPANILTSTAARELARGMLDGLATGRPELGDKFEPGIAFIANPALQITSRRASGEVKRFWQSVDRDTFALVGEEYPKFVGDPERSAFVESSGQRHMAAAGGVLASLASKYMVGVTPGYHLAPGYGGNLKGKSGEGVDAWRAAFLRARARLGVTGFAVFSIHGRNGLRSVMSGVLDGISPAIGGTPSS
ncbi:MAG: hypothetical protein ACJ77M_18765 [Thermoleophilaceae bacterium]